MFSEEESQDGGSEFSQEDEEDEHEELKESQRYRNIQNNKKTLHIHK